MFNRERGFNGGGVVRKGKPFLFLFQRVKKYYGRGGGFIKPIVGTIGKMSIGGMSKQGMG